MLWGAMNNATQAMMATSWDMGSISQNIANVNTVGYKRKESLFKTVLSEQTATAAPGGGKIFTVRATDRYHITNQGVVTPTGNPDDLAISGRGFFMLAPPAANGGVPTTATTDDPSAVLYSRAGQFHEIAGTGGKNYFVNSAGYHLLGWMADQQGVVTQGSLEPVYSQPATKMVGQATTTASIAGNIDAGTPAGATAYSSTQAVTSTAAGAQTLTYTWTRTGATTWNVAAAASGGGTVTSNANFTVDVDAFGNILTASPPTSIGVDFGGGTETFPLSVSSLKPPSPKLQNFAIPVYDNNAKAQTIKVGFERTGPNQWYMHVVGQNTPGTITFDGNGKISSGASQALNVTFTDNSTTPATTSTAAVTLDLSMLEQYNSPQYINAINQDGYADGMLRRADFNQKGEYVGTYDNGEVRTLFKVPVSTFISENNLDPISGTMFRRTKEAGDITVSAVEDAASGGGHMDAATIENSTVDIEDEFTRMIMTQKAYSTNATVFKTADEMTTTVRDLKS